MKQSWNEITIKDLMKIRDIDSLQMATPEEKNLKVASLIAEIPYEMMIQIPLADVREYMDGTEFLLHAPESVKARRSYTINGRKYNLFKNVEEMTVAQYLDFQQLLPEGFGNRPAEMLSVFLIPEGHNYNDGYDKETVVDDMYCMSVPEGLGIADFFSKRCQRLIRLMLTSLKIKMWWMTLTARKKEKELMKALELETKLVVDRLECIYGSLLYKR